MSGRPTAHPPPPAADATVPGPSRTGEATAIADEIVRQTTACGAGRSICPSDVARALDADWRRLLAPVRRAAAQLADAGRIDILRKGKPIPPQEMRGVIRLRLRATDGAGG
jgi:hypothetical protein